MSLRLLFISAIAISFAGCATVDIADMASGGQVQTIEISDKKNVVIKATDSLQANFKDQAWGQAPIAERVKSAANVLLKGRKKNDRLVVPASAKFETSHVPLTALRSDILVASKDVAKTVKASEIYLDVAHAQAELKPELKALEKAYMSSRRAEVWFEKTLKKIDGVDVEAELSTFAASVDRLRESTNQYGRRVRERSRAMKAPAS